MGARKKSTKDCNGNGMRMKEEKKNLDKKAHMNEALRQHTSIDTCFCRDIRKRERELCMLSWLYLTLNFHAFERHSTIQFDMRGEKVHFFILSFSLFSMKAYIQTQ